MLPLVVWCFNVLNPTGVLSSTEEVERFYEKVEDYLLHSGLILISE